MSVMCKLDGKCSTEKGLCIHEKMMLGMMIVGVLVAIAHWVLKLF